MFYKIISAGEFFPKKPKIFKSLGVICLNNYNTSSALMISMLLSYLVIFN